MSSETETQERDPDEVPEESADPTHDADGVNGFVRAGSEDYWITARGDFEEKDINGYAPSPESDRLRVEVPEFTAPKRRRQKAEPEPKEEAKPLVFEGPFDLLLHLIQKHAFDIFNIPITQITEAYLLHLDEMRALDLDVAGEFLVMASRLAHIKSRMLLPKEERPDDDEEDLVDPRVELVRRLLEYKRFKEVAEKLGQRPILYRDVFYRLSPNPNVEIGGPLDELGLGLRQLPVMKLIETFDKILRRSKKKIVHEVIAERMNVGARINELVDFAREREHFTFEDVVEKFGGRSRQNLIVTFLAVLEMTKLKLLRLHQADVESAIYLSPIRENLAGEWSDDIELSAGGEEDA